MKIQRTDEPLTWRMNSPNDSVSYEEYMAVVESGRLGHVDNPSQSHDAYNADLRRKALITSEAFQWLADNNIVVAYETNYARMMMAGGSTALIVFQDAHDENLFVQWLEQPA